VPGDLEEGLHTDEWDKLHLNFGSEAIGEVIPLVSLRIEA
jgi:hypothetical protein